MPITLVPSKELDGMVCSFELSLLRATGELRNVKEAIKTKDLAAIVRASTRALKKTDMHSKLYRAAEHKTSEASNKFRRIGNEHYQKKNYKDALLYYNKALSYAPKKSLEMKLAYGNISAVTLSMREHKATIENIVRAQELEGPAGPESLRAKLEKRMNEAKNSIAKEFLGDVVMSQFEKSNFINFNVKRNKDMPCVSMDVHVDDDKNVVAAKEIKSGTLVALERAFVSNQDKSAKYTFCYYCHKMSFFLIPCEGCTKALFCSKECKDRCLAEYHRIECYVVDYMYIDHSDINQELNKLALKAAVQLSLKLGWEQLRAASLDMGKERLKRSSVAEAFDCNNPTSLLCYDDQVSVARNVLINKALFCSAVLQLIDSVPNYWPKDQKEKDKAIDSLARIILHLNTTFKRKITIAASPNALTDNQRNEGWFSFASKLPHSCEPNLLVLGFHDRIALVTMQRINEGDPLTISYIDHFYDMHLEPSPKGTRIRQQIIQHEIQYTCECRVCLLEWESDSHVNGTLTPSQRAAYKKCIAAMDTPNFDLRMKAIGNALDELTGCNNTTQHRYVYHSLRRTTNIVPVVRHLLNKWEGF